VIPIRSKIGGERRGQAPFELPLAFGLGEGADAQAPVARAVVGRLSASTLITLVLVPVVYSLFHAESKKPIDNGQRASL